MVELRLIYKYAFIYWVLKKFPIQIDGEKTKINNESFKRVFDQHWRMIVAKIEELGGAEWVEKDINIYLVPYNFIVPVVAYPLILKVKEDQDRNLYVLIHELVHRYLDLSLEEFKNLFSGQIVGRERAEAITELVARIVSEQILGKERTSVIVKFLSQKVNSVDMAKVEPLTQEYQKRWDLNEKPLVEWFKEEK